MKKILSLLVLILSSNSYAQDQEFSSCQLEAENHLNDFGTPLIPIDFAQWAPDGRYMIVSAGGGNWRYLDPLRPQAQSQKWLRDYLRSDLNRLQNQEREASRFLRTSGRLLQKLGSRTFDILDDKIKKRALGFYGQILTEGIKSLKIDKYFSTGEVANYSPVTDYEKSGPVITALSESMLEQVDYKKLLADYNRLVADEFDENTGEDVGYFIQDFTYFLETVLTETADTALNDAKLEYSEVESDALSFLAGEEAASPSFHQEFRTGEYAIAKLAAQKKTWVGLRVVDRRPEIEQIDYNLIIYRDQGISCIPVLMTSQKIAVKILNSDQEDFDEINFSSGKRPPRAIIDILKSL